MRAVPREWLIDRRSGWTSAASSALSCGSVSRSLALRKQKRTRESLLPLLTTTLLSELPPLTLSGDAADSFDDHDPERSADRRKSEKVRFCEGGARLRFVGVLCLSASGDVVLDGAGE